MILQLKNAAAYILMAFGFVTYSYAAGVDKTLVYVDSTSTVGEWDPLPGTTIAINEQSEGVLSEQSALELLNGSLTYGIAEYCDNNNCAEDYTFSVVVENKTCTVINPGYLSVILLPPTIVDNNLLCNVYASLEVVPNSPQIDVIINNQIGSTAHNSFNYTYDLFFSATDVEQGVFPDPLVDIPVNQSSAPFTLTAVDGPDSYYAGKIIYQFDDAAVAGTPTSLEIDIKNTHGDVQCEASVLGWNDGYRIYASSSRISGNTSNATCMVDVTSVINPHPLDDYEFKQVAALPTDGISQWEAFKIAGENYLLAANAQAQSASYFKTNLFHFNMITHTFDPIQLVIGRGCYVGNDYQYLRDHANNWEYVKLGEQDWLAMANHYSYASDAGGDQCYPDLIEWMTTSYIFQWDYTHKRVNLNPGTYASFKTDSAIMWTSYTANNKSYVAVVEGYKAGARKLSIYQWNEQDNTFSAVQVNDSFLQSPYHIAPFYVVDKTYLVISQSGDDDTLVYQVANNGQLILHQGRAITPDQVINAQGFAQHAQVFNANEQQYLLLGYRQEVRNSKPQLYRWQYTDTCACYLFIPIQNLPDLLGRASSWVHYQINGKDFLAAALGTYGALAYLWNPQLQTLETEFPFSIWNSTDNIVSLSAFSINNEMYLALAKSSDSAGNKQTLSPIIRWQQTQLEKPNHAKR